MRKLLLEGLTRRPLTEPPPATDDAALAELARELDDAARRRLGPQPVDPPGRCRLLQRLRAGDPRPHQRLLRPGALRPALRRLAAPRRRAAGDRPGHPQHARGAGAHLGGHAGLRNGWSRSATAPSTAASSPAATRSSGGVEALSRSIFTFPAVRLPRPHCCAASSPYSKADCSLSIRFEAVRGCCNFLSRLVPFVE